MIIFSKIVVLHYIFSLHFRSVLVHEIGWSAFLILRVWNSQDLVTFPEERGHSKDLPELAGMSPLSCALVHICQHFTGVSSFKCIFLLI